MLDFRSRTPAPNYLSRREQRRLLLLVALLGLVAYLIAQARDPRRWEWFANLHAEGAATVASTDAAAPSEAEFDTRLSSAQAPETSRVPHALDTTVIVSLVEKDTAAAPSPGRLPGVRSDLMARVKDDTPFRGAEHEAWFHLFDLLRTTEPALVAGTSVGQVDFAQLFQQSSAYRGDVVTVAGTVRRAIWVAAPKNQLGLEGYYQLTLQPSGYHPSPIIVYVLALPAGFPTGESVSADATITGIYFKRWAYAAQDEVRLAPVVLAATVDWRQPVSLAPMNRAAPRPTTVVVTVVVVMAAAAWLVYRVSRTGRSLPKRELTAPDWSRVVPAEETPSGVAAPGAVDSSEDDAT